MESLYFFRNFKKNFNDAIKFEEITNLNVDHYVRFNKNRTPFNKKTFVWFYSLSRNIYCKFINDDKYFISDTYIGKFNEILLNLKLKNFPLLISPRSYLFTNPNYSLRKKLSLQVKS